MSTLFHLNDADTALRVDSTRFAKSHSEAELQRWAEQNPALLNDGQPMLSLGIEIVTGHGQAIDNLYVDGNGVLVAAELKRGKSPRDVTAQIVDYAAHVAALEWEDIDELCQQYRQQSLTEAYNSAFGSALSIAQPPEHRLLIVSESFDRRVVDAATYLINAGVPLALVRFEYFQVNEIDLMTTSLALGEIPEQVSASTKPSLKASPQANEAAEGKTEWLLATLKTKIVELQSDLRAEFEIRQGQHSISFAPKSWPFKFGDCQFRIWAHVHTVGVYFSYTTEILPGTEKLLEAAIAASWGDSKPPTMKDYQKTTTLAASISMPRMGDMTSVDHIVGQCRKLMEIGIPIVEASIHKKNGRPL